MADFECKRQGMSGPQETKLIRNMLENYGDDLDRRDRKRLQNRLTRIRIRDLDPHIICIEKARAALRRSSSEGTSHKQTPPPTESGKNDTS